LGTDDAQSIEKLETVTAHLTATGRIVCTPAAPEKAPEKSTTSAGKVEAE
jgi:hypothetical protein